MDVNDSFVAYKDIDFGSTDAEDYISNGKELLNAVFIRDDTLEALLTKNIYFLVGEKGTGKTAYAVFFMNNDYKNTSSVKINFEDTNIPTFINMKNQGVRMYSDCKEIWEVVLLIQTFKQIRESDLDGFGVYKRKKYAAINDVLKQYNLIAFTPEIKSTLSIINKNADSIVSTINARLSTLSSGAEGTIIDETTNSKERRLIQNPIHILKNALKNALSGIRLKRNKFIFIDKIDNYHSQIDFEEYILWVKSLAETTYDLNNSVFGTMKGSKGFIKIILLFRPDLFNRLHMYNQGGRVENNSIILDWQTTYKDYRQSRLFELADNMLKYSNRIRGDKDEKPVGYYWDFYFPWKARSTNPKTREYDDAFIGFLRLSLCRPRDIISFLKSIQRQVKNCNLEIHQTTENCFYSYGCQKSISDYFLQEAQDWCLYKYPYGTFDTIEYFFDFMNTGKPITFKHFSELYHEYIRSCRARRKMKIFEEMETEEDFLQLLFELNLICYIENYDSDDSFQTYCYRLRSLSDLSPKIPPNKLYRVHRALLKSLNIEEV